MKLLRLLNKVTGKKYTIWIIFYSPRKIRLDSITYIDLIVQAEKLFKFIFSEDLVVRLFSMPLFLWTKKLRGEKHNK